MASARLLLSFIAISSFALVAAVVGNYAFYAIGQSLQQVTEKSVPPAIATLELAQRAERIIATGPALLGVTNSEDFTAVSSVLDREVQEAGRLLCELPGQGLTAEKLIEIKVIFDRVTANIESLKSAVQARNAAADRNSALVRGTFDAYNQFRSIWTPKFNELKGHILALQRTLDAARSTPEERLTAFDRLNTAIRDLTPLEQIQQDAAVAFETLVRAGGAGNPADLDSIRIEAEKAVRRIDDVVSGVDPDVSLALIVPLESLANQRDRQCEHHGRPAGRAECRPGGSSSDNRERRPLGPVEQRRESLVAASKNNIATATERTRSVQYFGRLGLAVVVALSLISSVLIGWLYVGRNVVTRLTTLSDGMRALIGGRRDITIPTSGRDEIAEMARAVEVFRDNAIVLDQLLAEREQAAARLEKVVEERAPELQQRGAVLRVTIDNMATAC